MSQLCVDFDRTNGTIRPLHGVNNGPIAFGSLCDSSRYFRELSIPWIRLHDTNWPHPREVDIPQIFPDFQADPEDPSNYEFDRTDNYIKSVLDTGAKITYRLGVSIEHTAKVYYARPPEDFAKWAKICIGIIKHYNNGWANGFHYGIQYWEIWNEAPNGSMWFGGTWDQYLELYSKAAFAIKAFDPSLKIGGPSAASISQIPAFIAYCRNHSLPMDFLSWHCYGYSLQAALEGVRMARVLLDENGFADAECHLNEWNYWPRGYSPDPTAKPVCSEVYLRREFFEQVKNEVGASFAASMLIRMQDEAVDVLNYYDAQPVNWFCGLFDHYGIPQKTYYAFKAFRNMLDYPERVCTRLSDDGDDCCLAAIDRSTGTAAILIARPGSDLGVIEIAVNGLPVQSGFIMETRIIDKFRNFELVKTELVSSEIPPINLFCSGPTVAMISFRPPEVGESFTD